MSLHFSKLIKIVDTGDFRPLFNLSSHFCFPERSTGSIYPILRGKSSLCSFPSGFWLGAAKPRCSRRPQSLCRVPSKGFSESSIAPSYHLGWCQVGQLEEERQFILLGVKGGGREVKYHLQICSRVKLERWPGLALQETNMCCKSCNHNDFKGKLPK